LKVETSPPSDFQELLISDYPTLEIHDGVEIALQVKAGQAEQIRSSRSYRFFSSARDWQVGLASGFIALTANKYTRWEEFESRLKHAVEALLKAYPSIHDFTRIGLRYRDIIDRSELSLVGRSWTDLLRGPVIGWLGAGPLPEDAATSFNSTILFIHDDVRLRIQSGLVLSEVTKEQAFILDADYYTEAKVPADLSRVVENANRLHRFAGPFFRWCITEELHRALGPQKVEN
jgi:uncharacterized protein (TIGR04255 family)